MLILGHISEILMYGLGICIFVNSPGQSNVWSCWEVLFWELVLLTLQSLHVPRPDLDVHSEQNGYICFFCLLLWFLPCSILCKGKYNKMMCKSFKGVLLMTYLSDPVSLVFLNYKQKKLICIHSKIFLRIVIINKIQ